jgi:hypothetical protein
VLENQLLIGGSPDETRARGVANGACPVSDFFTPATAIDGKPLKNNINLFGTERAMVCMTREHGE